MSKKPKPPPPPDKNIPTIGYERRIRRLTERLEKARNTRPRTLKHDDRDYIDDVCWLLEYRPPDDEIIPDSTEEIEPERDELERRAMAGDYAALADLVRRDIDYLKPPLIGAIIRSLQHRARNARTPEERQDAMSGLRTIAGALVPDLRGQAPKPHPVEVALVYRHILAVYQAVKRGKPPPEVPLPRGYWKEVGPCPPNVRPAGPYHPDSKRVTLLPSPVFVVPQKDILLLKDKHYRPSDLARERAAQVFGLSIKTLLKYISQAKQGKFAKKILGKKTL